MQLDLVVFDLGSVLINVDMQRLMTNFAQALHLSTYEITAKWQSNKRIFTEFDTGNISPQEFYHALIDEKELLSFTEFCHIYTDIFSVNEATLQIAKKITLPLTILSNTDELHFERIKNFHILHHFTSITTSFNTHLLKPDVRIYQKVLEKFTFPAQRILFIDDRPENVQGAQATGMQAIHFTSADVLQNDLQQFDIYNN